MILNTYEWGAPHAGLSSAKLEAKKKKILFLHGLGGLGQLWRPVAAALESEFHIIAPDQRGHGKSIPSMEELKVNAHFHPKSYAKDIVQTMEAKIFYPSFLVGHSMGARTALFSAMLQPDYFQGIVLVDLGLTGPAGGGLGQKLSLFLGKLPHQFQKREDARAFLSQECPDPAIAQYLMAVMVKTPQGEFQFPFHREALLATLEQAVHADGAGALKEIAKKGIPVLLLRGEKSTVWSEAQYLQEKSQFVEFPHIQFETMAECGHGLPFEKRKEFTERLRSFILDQES